MYTFVDFYALCPKRLQISMLCVQTFADLYALCPKQISMPCVQSRFLCPVTKRLQISMLCVQTFADFYALCPKRLQISMPCANQFADLCEFFFGLLQSREYFETLFCFSSAMPG
jgi:hypothetical protein